VDKEVYGLWLTISSIITFLNLFDLGLANGLRNSITEAYAKKDFDLIKTYVSTTYAIFILVLVPICLLFLSICNFINWQSIFNTKVDKGLLVTVIRYMVLGFSLQIILQPITALLLAMHKHYLSSISGLLSNIVALLLIILLGHYFDSSFLFLSIVFSTSSIVVMLLFSFFLYRGPYSLFSPSIKCVKLKEVKSLFQLGLKFFIIQIAGLIMYSSNYIIISQYIGNQAVTTYNIVFRLFSGITTFQSLVIAPLWTGYGDAYIKRDFGWIQNVIKKANLLNWALCAILVLILIGSNYIYKFWIGHDFTVPFLLSLLMTVNVGITLFATNYTIFVNGTGKIRLQTYKSIVSGLLHFPIAYILVKKMDLGINGLVLLNIFWMLVALVLWRFQYQKILLKGTSRIWNT
jgi:O-antigen/teichoic acid export membrane protein